MPPRALARADQDTLPTQRQTQRTMSENTVCAIKPVACEPPGLIAKLLDGPPLPKHGTHLPRRDS
jgi:hypothetical protein